jgi:hypothetical protein
MRTFVLTAAAALLLGAAGSASAQTDDNSRTYVYGSAGYTGHQTLGGQLGTVDGRLGARWGWFGVEGQAGWGVNHLSTGPGQSAGLNDQQTIYGVAYLPLARNIDLFGRIGYGRTDWAYKGPGHPDDGDTNWNVGGGGQWFFAPKDGVRAEYTRESFDHAPQNAEDWSVSYVRKF